MTILARFDGEPALLAPGSESLFQALCLGAQEFLTRAEADAKTGKASDDSFWLPEDDWRSAYRPYRLSGGVLTIPVEGVLLNAYPWATPYATGYEYITQAFRRGMADEDVSGIRFLIDSPGGMVSGNFDLADEIHAGRGRKKMIAHAAESAYSAAYSIASAADRILVTRSGGVGSVGVVTTHVDMSKALDDMGVKVTFIHFGKHKVEGNAYEPLSPEAKKKIQARIDALGEEFVSIVARNRGMTDKAVKATEADIFAAQEAVANGFADEVARTEDGLAAFTASLTTDDEEDDDMAVKAEAPDTITQEQLDAAVAAARTEGAKAGAIAERARVQAILGSDTAKARPKAAAFMAFKTDKPAEEAAVDLADFPIEAQTAAPKSEAGAKSGAFEAAMDAAGPTGVGTGSDTQADKIPASQAAVNLAAELGIAGFTPAQKKE